MRKCETCGRETDGDWSVFFGFRKNEHGVCCQACGQEYQEGRRDVKEKRKEDLTSYDMPVYPPDDDAIIEKKPRARTTVINHVVQTTVVPIDTPPMDTEIIVPEEAT